MTMETDPSKIKKKKGKCRNFEGGDCVKAEVGEIQEIPSNELFVCQECKQPLTEVGSSGSKKTLPFILGGGSLFALFLIWAFWPSAPQPTPVPETFPLLVPGIVDQRLKQSFDPGQATDFELSQPLPAGLELDKMGYSIQGTPTAVGETLVTLKGINAEGKMVVEYEVTISITKAATSSATSTSSSEKGPNGGSGDPIAIPYDAVGELLFDQGSSDLKGEQIEGLRKMGERLKNEFKDCKYLVVTGYASREGEDGTNKRLSQERANNVARELKALGISQKVFVQPEGEAVQGRPDDQLARDRRVTINVYRN